MNCWNVLDIEPTSDSRVIKKAYAGKLKLHHPEDDPENFQQIRQAYESALLYAKYFAQIPDAPNGQQTTTVQNANENGKQSLNEVESELMLDSSRVDDSFDTVRDQFVTEAKVIYNNLWMRNDLKRWQAFLENELYWNLSYRPRLSYLMLKVLMADDEFPLHKLPTKVWRLLNEHFFWLDERQKLYKSFPKDYIDHVLDNVCTEPVPLHCIVINAAKKCLRISWYFVWFSFAFSIIILFLQSPVYGIGVGLFGVVFMTIYRLFQAFRDL